MTTEKNNNYNEQEKIIFETKKATIDDLPAIQTLNKKLFSYEIGEGFDDNLDADWSFSREGKKEIQERITSKENSCGFIVKVDGEIVSYLIGLILEEETGRAESKYAELEHMFVDKEFRSMGIGNKLVEEFKSWVKDKKISRVKVNISYGNKGAINFYKKVGLAPADITMSMNID